MTTPAQLHMGLPFLALTNFLYFFYLLSRSLFTMKIPGKVWNHFTRMHSHLTKSAVYFFQPCPWVLNPRATHMTTPLKWKFFMVLSSTRLVHAHANIELDIRFLCYSLFVLSSVLRCWHKSPMFAGYTVI